MVVWYAIVRNVYVQRPNSKNLINFLRRSCWKNSSISKITVNRLQQVPKVTARSVILYCLSKMEEQIQNCDLVTITQIYKTVIFAFSDIRNSQTAYSIFGSTLQQESISCQHYVINKWLIFCDTSSVGSKPEVSDLC